jgi:hypothetical protein
VSYCFTNRAGFAFPFVRWLIVLQARKTFQCGIEIQEFLPWNRLSGVLLTGEKNTRLSRLS